jgi:hypothetical protein
MRTAATVPKELRGLVMQAVKLGRTWSCWTDGTQTWLFTAEMSRPLSRERPSAVDVSVSAEEISAILDSTEQPEYFGASVLQVNLYRDDGTLQASGGWIYDRDGNWRRCGD